MRVAATLGASSSRSAPRPGDGLGRRADGSQRSARRDEAAIAARSPAKVDLAAGRTCFWCCCGRSKRQPFCDGTHRETTLLPLQFKAEETGTVYLCRSKRTSSAPHCDGTHSRLPPAPEP